MAKNAESTEVVAVEATIIENSHEKESASIESYISQAIGVNASVETMERLFALREKVKAEQAKEAFVAAMAKFQSECPVIKKDKKVLERGSTTKVRYRYAPLDSIVDQVKIALGNNGLSYTMDVVNKEGLLTVICKITHVLGHSETSSFEVPIDMDSYMSAPQKYASASTFAKRYAFCNALGILTGDEDTDAQDVTTPPAKKAPATPPVDEEMERWRSKIRIAKDMKQLKEIWEAMPKKYVSKLKAEKEEMKVIIESEKGK